MKQNQRKENSETSQHLSIKNTDRQGKTKAELPENMQGRPMRGN